MKRPAFLFMEQTLDLVVFGRAAGIHIEEGGRGCLIATHPIAT